MQNNHFSPVCVKVGHQFHILFKAGWLLATEQWPRRSPPTVAAHHFTVGVLAESRRELDGPHEDEEQTQGEGQGHDGYCPRRRHDQQLPLACSDWR